MKIKFREEEAKVIGPNLPISEKILTPDALRFIAKLHRKFNPTRLALLTQRQARQEKIDRGQNPDFLSTTAEIRNDASWQVAPTPPDLQKRWVEITGPTDKKMLINALNSGADVFMADFEDANSPTWKNMVEGQANLIEAIAGTISFTSPEGKKYELNKQTAVLLMRPRGWHLNEKHVTVDGEPVSASLFDFGLYFFHNVKNLIKKGSGPYFYLPKLESHLEARLWNDVFLFVQNELEIPAGTIRATVLIETILAAFEMEEILYELREHSAGLNAGRWDYIFSIIKKFRARSDFIFPDRAQITMNVPFMRAYTELLIATCHKRGAHAMGGMAAFVPSRKDVDINKNALEKVREDKLRESSDGFDGTWVAHPDLVSVAHDIFSAALNQNPHQKQKKINASHVTAKELLNFDIAGGKITEEGMRKDISVTLIYLDSWLCGVGAAAIYNLMEDVATAEICRSQLWQWIHHPKAILNDGTKITPELYRRFADQEMEKIKKIYGEKVLPSHQLTAARELLDKLVLNEQFSEFLTLEAYPQLD